MKKMATLFRVDYHKKGDPGVIHNEVRPENEWVFTETDYVSITRKWDGQAAAIIEGVLYRRYDAEQGKQAPEGAIPCCDPDPISGHHPHWVKVSPDSPNDKFLWETWFEDKKSLLDGTYEFCGEKVGGNPENITGSVMITSPQTLNNDTPNRLQILRLSNRSKRSRTYHVGHSTRWSMVHREQNKQSSQMGRLEAITKAIE